MPDGLPLRPDDPAELGGHRILGRLGEGNQGVVYLGRAPSGERVAIKVLRARMAEDPAAHERFVRELSAAKKVARFCTAQVLAADIDDDRPYIVSEYVEGRSLRSHILEEGPRTGGALERLAIGTLTALAAIHKAGIVHRDFTPHNVLLGPDGPRVIDFGIARALGAARNDEANSVGTPSYMAPEQVAGREIGPPADMFAWGSTILFAATGRPPFGNESVHAVMRRIMESEPDVSALEEPLRSVVAACLAKDPAKRPTARQAQTGLLGDEATEALMPPPAFGTAPSPPAPPGPDTGAPPVPVAPPGPPPGPAGPAGLAGPVGDVGFHSPVTPAMAAASAGPPGGRPAETAPGSPESGTETVVLWLGPAGKDTPRPPEPGGSRPRLPAAPADTRVPGTRPPGAGPLPAAPPGRPMALPEGGPGARPRAGGSVLTPAPGAALPAGTAPGGWRRRVRWAVLAGAAMVVAGAAVAVPLWPHGGDAATASKARATADVPPTPTPTPVAPVTPRTQMNGVRSGVPRPTAEHSTAPARGCRDYQHVYTMLGAGTVLLHVSVCRDVFSGTAGLVDSAPDDGWDVCVQLRGHVAGPGPATYMSTTPMTSRDGRVHSFQNGPKVKFGAKTKTTEDSVAVNAGKCQGSGTQIQTSWQTQEQLAAG
jgi:predicted Ser/Thr protein kinase